MPRKSEKKPKDILTDKQRKFVEFYVYTGRDGATALDLAGYEFDDNASDTACNKRKYVTVLLNNPNVQKYLTEVVDAYSAQISVDKTWVIDKLKERVENGSENIQIKALELIGKSFGMFSDRQIIERADDPAEIAQKAFEERKKQLRLVKKEEEDVDAKTGNA